MKKRINCDHWQQGGRGYGICSLELYGGRPSFGTCRRCEHYRGEGGRIKEEPVRGLGIGTKRSSGGGCGGCKRKKENQ